MLRPGHMRPPKDGAAEVERAAAHERKQEWKTLPGNRYTIEELSQMSRELGKIVILRKPTKMRVMYLP